MVFSGFGVRLAMIMRWTALVKDYSTPSIEQGLAAWADVQGRRWIILRGGNRGSGLVLWPTAEKSGANVYTRCIVAFWP